MTFNTNGRNAMVNGLAAVISHISVHDSIPDATGSAEVAGVARQAATWAAPAGGTKATSADVSHTMGAGSAAVAYGGWGALSGGTHYGHWLVGSSKSGFATVDSAGVTGDVIQSAAHGLTNGNRIGVYHVVAETLPAGLAEGTLYFVVGATTNTLQVSTTAGGAAVNITGQGELWWQDCVPEAFGSAGTLLAVAGAIVLDAVVI